MGYIKFISSSCTVLRKETFHEKARINKIPCLLSFSRAFFSTQTSSMATNNTVTETILIDGIQHSFSREETDEHITTLLAGPEKTYQGVFDKDSSTLAVYTLDTSDSRSSFANSTIPLFEISVTPISEPLSYPIVPQASNVDYFFARIFYSSEPNYSYIKYDDNSYEIHIKDDRYIDTPANTPSNVVSRCETFKEKAVQSDSYFDGAVAATTSTICPTYGSIRTVADIAIKAYTGTMTYRDWAALIVTGVSSLPGLTAFGQLMSAADATSQWSLLFSCMVICRDSFDYVAARY